jgi:hypothetical protein
MHFCTLQRTTIDVDGRTIRQSHEVDEASFEEKALIPKSRFRDISYVDGEGAP